MRGEHILSFEYVKVYCASGATEIERAHLNLPLEFPIAI